MTEYTRLHVAGSVGRAELVVPDDQPLGAVMPQLLQMLAEPTPSVERALTLVTGSGVEVDITRSPAELALGDGTMLRLTRVDAAPPPPVVIDVADSTAERHDDRRDRWNDRARVLTAAVAVGVFVAVGLALLPLPAEAALWAGISMAAAFLVATVLCGLLGADRISALLTGAAFGTVPSIAVLASAASPRGGVATLTTAILVAAIVVVLGVGVARRSRAALAGGAIGLALAALQLSMLAVPGTIEQSLTVPLIVALAVCGVLPWVALAGSGLATLDRHVADDGVVSRAATRSTIDAAYATLTWGVGAVVAIVALDAAILIANPELWSVLLGTASVVVLAMRTRSFPLIPAQLLLWGGVVVIVCVGAAAHVTSLGVVGLLLIAAVAAITAMLGLLRPTAHVRARLRGYGNALEMLAVVALVPLALGVWGVYADLLGLFSGPAS